VSVHHYAKVSKRTKEQHATAKDAGGGPWSVPALCAAYAWPKNAPGNSKPIAIVELGGGWVQADVAQFFQSVGQPLPTITDVSVDGTENQGVNGGDASVEVALDIQVLAAAYYVATGKAANLRIYWSTDIATAVAKAAADGCCVCSISWGDNEGGWGNAAVQAMQSAAAAAVESGMIVFAASGDNDADDSDGTGVPAVDCPASCPSVVGCGGTNKTSASETVWQDNAQTDASGEGTGGGFSSVFPVQSWQVGAPTPPKGLGRLVPDVAANADPNTGYEIIQGGQTQVVGGTSAVAPLMSALFAAVGASGNVLTKIWSNPKAFNDITSGSNGAYSAQVGPDACSGVGSPIGTAIATLFATSITPPAPAPPVPVPTPPMPSGLLTAAQVAGVKVSIAAVIDAQDPLMERSVVGTALAAEIDALGPVPS
jgi:kumamolisin